MITCRRVVGVDSKHPLAICIFFFLASTYRHYFAGGGFGGGLSCWSVVKHGLILRPFSANLLNSTLASFPKVEVMVTVGFHFACKYI